MAAERSDSRDGIMYIIKGMNKRLHAKGSSKTPQDRTMYGLTRRALKQKHSEDILLIVMITGFTRVKWYQAAPQFDWDAQAIVIHEWHHWARTLLRGTEEWSRENNTRLGAVVRELHCAVETREQFREAVGDLSSKGDLNMALISILRSITFTDTKHRDSQAELLRRMPLGFTRSDISRLRRRVAKPATGLRAWLLGGS